MPRAIWSGAISFGLVNVPVKLYSATSPKTVRFHQVSSKTGTRIRQQRIDPTTGDEVVAPDKLDELDAVEEAEASERELRMAQQLIGSLSGDFEPAKYHDEYRERVLELIERKAAGQEIAVQPQVEEPAAAPDLMAALEASLAAVRGEEEKAPAKGNGAKARKPKSTGGSRKRAKAKT